MQYTITAKIDKETVCETELNSNNINLVFHMIMDFVNNTKEEAYETDSDWSVLVQKDGSEITIKSKGEYTQTVINGKDKGIGYWDSYLSNWL